jgi:hypothetical protein
VDNKKLSEQHLAWLKIEHKRVKKTRRQQRVDRFLTIARFIDILFHNESEINFVFCF